MNRVARLRWLLAVLLASSTVLFAVGVALERNSADTHATGVEERRGEAHSEAAEQAERAAAQAAEGERVAGIDLESTPLVVLAVAFGLALTVAVLTRLGQDRRVLVAIGLVMLAWAVLDGAEVAHRLEESNGGIAALASVVAVLHLAAAVVSVWLARRERVTA